MAGYGGEVNSGARNWEKYGTVIEEEKPTVTASGPGNPDALRDWYDEGARGQIDWGSPGDLTRCHDIASDYMDSDLAWGFCQERHIDATGAANSPKDDLALLSLFPAWLGAELEVFYNECHSGKDGEFCSGADAAGDKGARKIEKASNAEVRKARQQAKEKMANAKAPSKEKACDHREKMKAAGRAGGEFRGSSADRKRRQQNLWREFGGADKGYVVDHITGIKMHWTADKSENPNQYPVFTQGKIFTGAQGGSYTNDNLIPESLQGNQARNDQAVRTENLGDIGC